MNLLLRRQEPISRHFVQTLALEMDPRLRGGTNTNP